MDNVYIGFNGRENYISSIDIDFNVEIPDEITSVLIVNIY